jgi:DNA-binding transcriptional LysR family regulator
VDTVISASIVMELVQAFYSLGPVTRLRLRDESLSGTLETLTSGQADLALGVVLEASTASGVQSRVLGDMQFIFAVAPHHPLAPLPEPLPDDLLQKHRAVAVADSVQRGAGLTLGLLAGQDVLTVPTMRSKLDAQLRGLGAGFVPEPMARPYLESGRLVAKETQRTARVVRISVAWRTSINPGRGLQWWLAQLDSPTTRRALIEEHRMPQ